MTNLNRVVTGVVGLAFAVMACAAFYAPEETAPSTQVQTPTSAPATAVSGPPTYGDGTYQVGDDILPGTYYTNGSQGDASCYYARLSEASSSAIIENDLFNGPSYLLVGEGDMFLQLSGGCVWSRDA